jgi:inner membrane protein
LASPITHAAIALSLGAAWTSSRVDWKFLAWGIICAEIPDTDVLGFWLGVPYAHVWGHRGFTHSLLFAALFALLPTYVVSRCFTGRITFAQYLYFFFATVSHGISDAITDAGLGVAFLAPFDTTRYFFRFRPVGAAPLSWEAFFSPIGIRVLASEVLWIWVPCCVFVAGILILRWKREESP